jgi:uncharacterized membrane protein YeaQ/YmgE (transglycosylase-associated protein family)
VDLLVSIAVVLAAAFLVGTVARFAVPGPDPMPVWLTTAVGLAGAFVGALLFGLVSLLAGGEPAGEPGEPAGEEAVGGLLLMLFFVAIIGATIVVVLFRRFVQKRPVTGPDAHRPPLRPRGLRRILAGRPHRYVEETANPEEGWAPDQLQKLVLLKEAGKIDEEEYERRKSALVERL